MNKNELLGEKLYTVVSSITDIPHITEGKCFLIYTDKEKAVKFAERVKKLQNQAYPGATVNVCLITNNENFLSQMVYLGYSLFIYNGSGKVHNLNEILGINYVAVEKYTDVYESYINLLHMKKSAHIGSVKSQKIDNLYRYFSQTDIAPIKNDFLHKQKALSRCYTAEPQNTTYVYERPQSGNVSREMLEKTEQEKNEAKEALRQEAVIKKDTINQNKAVQPVHKQTKTKEKRPIVAVIMFILLLICVLGFIGAKDMDDTGTMASFAIGAVMYFGLGVGMLNSYIKRFGWAILAVFFTMLAISEFYIDVTVGFVLLVFVFVFLGLFIWGNRAKD